MSQLQHDAMSTESGDETERDSSKTQRKREMHTLQTLGEELVNLPRDRLAKITLPDVLREAVLDAVRIGQRGARRRQIQYIGKLMRDVDANAIQEQIEATRSGSPAAAALLHRAEKWRERLLADDSLVSEFIVTYPAADVQKLRTLLRNTKHEAAVNKPPRSFRALFREIRGVLTTVD